MWGAGDGSGWHHGAKFGQALALFRLYDRPRVDWLNGFSTITSTERAEDAQGTPTKSHISPRILMYKDIYTQTEAVAVP